MKWNGILSGVGVLALALLPALAWSAEAKIDWRSDYARARLEATEKGRPILLYVGMDRCSWCKKLDEDTFADPAIIRTLNSQFIPLRIDIERHAALVESLGIQAYPTLVFASCDGRVLGSNFGFLDVPALRKQLNRTLSASGKKNRLARASDTPRKDREPEQAANPLLALPDRLPEGASAEPGTMRPQPKTESVDELLSKLETIKAQKADLEKAEKETIRRLKEMLKQQLQRLQQFDIDADGTVPDPKLISK